MTLVVTAYIINAEGVPRAREVYEGVSAIDRNPLDLRTRIDFRRRIEITLREKGKVAVDERVEFGPVGIAWGPRP